MVDSLSERYSGVTTIAQAFVLGEPALAMIKGDVKGSLKLHLSALSRFLNLHSTLTGEHIDFIADKLLSDPYYRWLKPADLKLFFDRVKMGRYGDFYGNLNSISFFAALDRYCIERNGEIERLRANEAAEERQAYRCANLPYCLDAEGRIVVSEERRTFLTTPQRDHDRERKVSNMAKFYVANEGMEYGAAIERAVEVLTNDPLFAT